MQAIFPLAYLPPLDFWTLALSYQHIGIEVNDSYQKQSYRNRCVIDSPNGALALSIPIVHGDSKITKDIKISYAQNWAANHMHAFDSSYGKSPFYEALRHELKSTLEQQFEYVKDLNLALIKLVTHWLQADINWETTKSWAKETTLPDYREHFHPKRESSIQFTCYPQVFDFKHGFRNNLSILDLLCNEGRFAPLILQAQ